MFVDLIPEGLKLWLATWLAASFDFALGWLFGLLGLSA